MLTNLDSKVDIKKIKNKVLADYAEIYASIYDGYYRHLAETGLELSSDSSQKLQAIKERLRSKGVGFQNNNHSISHEWISPACVACRTGEKTASYYIGLACHRDCYYCFNPNQENYEFDLKNKRNCISELDQLVAQGQKLDYIALTGGEPLLYKEDMLDFFYHANMLFPDSHKRLYSSGDLLDLETTIALKEAGLDEIRFSIKLEDSTDKQGQVLSNIGLARQYIDTVMVEMPVIPGSYSQMTELLDKLEELAIDGINLLEFCFPYTNIEEFRDRGFMIKNPAFDVLYNYWYAGGLAIADSEYESLKLLEYALDKGYKLGVHYCSLENKHTGQVYQQNKAKTNFPFVYQSPRDYFYKKAKVFGQDIPKVQAKFVRLGLGQDRYEINEDYNYIEFHVAEIEKLGPLDVELVISSNIVENREGELVLRELKLQLADLVNFQLDLL